MKNRFFLSAIFLITVSSCLWRCGSITSSAINRENFATQYYSEEKVLRPKYVLYNVTDSLTRLYFSVNSSDLLYTANNQGSGFAAHILLSYIVHPVDFPRVISDSGNIVLSDQGMPGENKLLGASTGMDIYIPGKYYLEVTFRDLNKNQASYEILYLDHSGRNSKDNFLISRDSSETPLFRNYVAGNEKIRIRYYNPKQKKLFVRYFKNKSGPAPPPYSTDRHPGFPAADSSYWMNYSPDETISLQGEGWYTFNSDSLSNSGLCISRFHDGFPKITVAKQLLYPLRYLTMRDEYATMDTAVNTKKAVDQFWIDNSGSQEHAREVIRNFYNRVEAANNFFATNIEGWKTDRGMIYLIFGPPGNVFRSVSYETWIYGSSAGNNALTFVFDQKDNPFSDQDFVLERNSDFKINWITAVDSWRQGHVYTLR